MLQILAPDILIDVYPIEQSISSMEYGMSEIIIAGLACINLQEPDPERHLLVFCDAVKSSYVFAMPVRCESGTNEMRGTSESPFFTGKSQ